MLVPEVERGRSVTDSSAPVDPERDVSLQGTYAGIMTRLGGFAIDIVVIAAVYALAGHVVDYIVSALRGEPFTLEDAQVFSAIALVAWAFFYCAYPLAVSGRTLGMAVVGLRAVRKDGRPLDGWHAALRVLVVPAELPPLRVRLPPHPAHPRPSRPARPDRRDLRGLRLGRPRCPAAVPGPAPARLRRDPAVHTDGMTTG